MLGVHIEWFPGVLRLASRRFPLRDLLRSDVHESVQISTRDNIRDENTFGDPHGSVQAPDLAFTMSLFQPDERRAIPVEVQDLTLGEKGADGEVAHV